MAKLCRVCKEVNFSAILTPREQNREATAIYRPELTGNGKTPTLSYADYGQKKQTGTSPDHLPQIRTAHYDNLSVSTASFQLLQDDGETLHHSETGMLTLDGGLAAEFSDIDDDDDEEVEREDDMSETSSILGQDDFPRLEVSLSDSPRPQTENQAINQDPSIIEETSDAAAITIRQQIPNARYERTEQTENVDRSSRSVTEGSLKDSNSNKSSSSRAGDHSSAQEDDVHERQSSYTESSESTWSALSHFSENDKIDLKKQAEGNWSYRHGHLYYLGSIWDVRSRRYECDLCHRLWRRMRSESLVKNTFMTKSRCVFKLVKFKCKSSENEPEREVNMLNLLFIYAFKLDDPELGNWIIRMPFVMQGIHRDVIKSQQELPAPFILLPFDDKLFGEARIRDQVCDFFLLREWLGFCEATHSHAVPIFKETMTIRLIDVKRWCLIEWSGPVSECPRFLALSYVWGRASQSIMLTTKNIDKLKEPGYLEVNRVPRTIEDAINVVFYISETYLWVDALCILQDSPEDKAIQIPQMHLIYGKAVLTIVAANGEDSEAGLPGVRPGTRSGTNVLLELDDIQVSMRTSIDFYFTQLDVGVKENYLSRHSVYPTRTWTFQEAFLSPRTLIFTRKQVYWECDACTWCEETCWESKSINFVGQRAVKDPTPEDEWEDDFDRNAYDAPPLQEEKKPEVLQNSYATLVKEYTDRKLSYDGDILNAFTGVLNSIKTRERSDFFFALRESCFGNDLLFNPITASPRRFLDKTALEAGFPSWSWLAWRGKIQIANEARNNSYDPVENLIPCDGVKCYVLEVDRQSGKRLRLMNETAGWRFREDYVRCGEGIFDPTYLHISRPVSPDYYGEENAAETEGTMEERLNALWETDYPTPEAKRAIREEMTAMWENAKGDETGDSWAEEVLQSSPPLEIEDHVDDPSVQAESPTFRPPASPSSISAEPPLDIPSYSQDLTLSEVESHPAFSLIQPNFHIIFCTFSSVVVLRTDPDGMRRRGMPPKTERSLYICKKEQKVESSETFHDGTENVDIEAWHREGEPPSDLQPRCPSHLDPPSHAHDCPTCHKSTLPTPPSRGYTLGPYFGHIPPVSTTWSEREYLDAIPDGVYTVLWMNNNQLPMWGHLLCREAKGERKDGGGVLERVCSVVGPVDILRREEQERWAAEWGCVVLG